MGTTLDTVTTPSLGLGLEMGTTLAHSDHTFFRTRVRAGNNLGHSDHGNSTFLRARTGKKHGPSDLTFLSGEHHL